MGILPMMRSWFLFDPCRPDAVDDAALLAGTVVPLCEQQPGPLRCPHELSRAISEANQVALSLRIRCCVSKSVHIRPNLWEKP